VLERFEPPADVEALTVWADRDHSETGERAARRLALRLKDRGQKVRVMVPEQGIPAGESGIDWLDVLNAQGAGSN
jgi:hypothetical protein